MVNVAAPYHHVRCFLSIYTHVATYIYVAAVHAIEERPERERDAASGLYIPPGAPTCAPGQPLHSGTCALNEGVYHITCVLRYDANRRRIYTREDLATS